MNLLIDHFSGLNDPGSNHPGSNDPREKATLYDPLTNVRVIAVPAAIAGAESHARSYEDILLCRTGSTKRALPNE